MTVDSFRGVDAPCYDRSAGPQTQVVDTHVQRISRRLHLTQKDDPKKIEQDLMTILPKKRWILFSHQIIHFGRSVCVARKPRCVKCRLQDLCYAPDKTV